LERSPSAITRATPPSSMQPSICRDFDTQANDYAPATQEGATPPPANLVTSSNERRSFESTATCPNEFAAAPKAVEPDPTACSARSQWDVETRLTSLPA
jgi:hypothetical protein